MTKPMLDYGPIKCAIDIWSERVESLMEQCNTQKDVYELRDRIQESIGEKKGFVELHKDYSAMIMDATNRVDRILHS